MGFFDNLYKGVTEDECVRDPVMNGLGVGTAAALLYFVGTGMSLKSIKVFCYVMAPVAVGSSILCSYNQRMSRLKSVHFRDAMKYKALTEGTDMDPSYVNNAKNE